MNRIPTPLFIGIVLASSPFFLLLFCGIHGGMPWDYSLVYASESSEGPSAFLYNSDYLRVFTNVFYHVGYLLSSALGMTGSFIGYHLVYAALWTACGILVYSICQLLGLGRSVALSAATLTTFSGADASIGNVGQLNQFGITFWSLLAICLFVYSLQKRTHRWPALIGSSFFGAIAVWSYEGVLFGLIGAPILLLSLTRQWRTVWPSVPVVLAPQIVYAYLMADRLLFHPAGTSWQESVVRHNWRVGDVAHDGLALLWHLFSPPQWLSAKSAVLNVPWSEIPSEVGWSTLMASLAIALAAAIVGGIIAPQCGTLGRRYRIEAAAVFLALASVFEAPFIAPKVGGIGLFWRTQILPSPFAAITAALTVGLLLELVFRDSLKRAHVWTFCLFLAFGCGISANVLSYDRWNASWDKIRDPIARILETVPDVLPGTVIVLQAYPPTDPGWDSNFWFDILLRLAYPHKLVAGSYTFAGDPDQPTDVKIAESGGGTVMTLSDRRKILAPHGQIFGVNGNNVELIKPFMPGLITKATLDQLIVLQWTGSGPMTLVLDIKKVDVAVAPSANYSPQLRIRQPESPIASRRFSP